MLKIEYAGWMSINELAVKQKGMPAVYVSNKLTESDADFYIWDKVQSRCGEFMSQNDVMDIMHGGLFFFKSNKSRDRFFNVFCEKPIYNSALFAVSYDKDGTCLSENT